MLSKQPLKSASITSVASAAQGLAEGVHRLVGVALGPAGVAVGMAVGFPDRRSNNAPAVCTTRSLTVGLEPLGAARGMRVAQGRQPRRRGSAGANPKGRVFPWPLGIHTRRTGRGRYVLARSSSSNESRQQTHTSSLWV